MDIMNIVLPYTLEVATTLLLALIGVAGTWLSTKIAQRTHLTNIGAAVEQVILAAQMTVGELQQTTVNALKAAAPDGKLTKVQIADLNQQLLLKTSAKLSAPVIQLLEAAKTDISAIITGAAENLIGKM